jgi:hypothetical protein
MSACPAPEELTSLALRHLDEAEAARLQSHVDRCPHCQESLAAWTDLLGLLPTAEPQVAPPPALKRRLLASLTPQELPVEPRPMTSLPHTGQPTPSLSAHGQPTPNLARSTPSRTSHWIGLVATLALILGGYTLWRVERLAPHTIALSGVGPASGARAQVALLTEGTGTRVTLTATGLPPLAPDEVYQLWAIKDGKRQAVCAFKVDPTGRGEANYWLPGPLAYDSLGVTREPSEDYHSQQPRGPKVLGSS